MRSVPTRALVAAVLLPLGAAWAAAPRPVEVHAAPAESRWIDRALRPLPLELGRPGPYALLERWVDRVAKPPPDGTARLVVVPVSGGLGLAWARRW